MNKKISIRISDSLNDKLSEVSEMENISVSELSRKILEDYFTSTNDEVEEDFQEIEEETSFEEDFYEDYEEENFDIVNEVEFWQLVLWIYDQKGERMFKFHKEELKKFKQTIIKIHSSTVIPYELKDEFNKVFVELIKEIESSYPFSSRPDFAFASYNGFNFPLLTEFIFNNGSKSTSITI